MNWYKKAKLSDYGGLLDQAIAKLDSVIDRVYPNGSFSLFFQDLNNKKVKIFVRLGENLESEVSQKDSTYFKLTINTSHNSKDAIYRTLAHEITHISQKYNGFARYEFEGLQKAYKQLEEKGIKPKWELIRELRHDISRTEHEAKLAGIFALLKRGNVELAANELCREPEYYHFDNHKFIKLFSYYGISTEVYKTLKNLVNNEVNNRLNMYRNKKYSLEKLQDFVRSMKPVFKMLNLNRQDAIDFVIGQIDDPNVSKVQNYRWNFIKEKLLESI